MTDATQRIAVTGSRLVLGAVFLYFGAGELVAPGPWIGYMPPFVPTHIALWLVLLHGFVLFMAGCALVLGLYWRFLSPLAVLLMGSVALELLFLSGPSAIWIRDLGLTGLALSLWASDGGFTVDRFLTAMPKAVQGRPGPRPGPRPRAELP